MGKLISDPTNVGVRDGSITVSIDLIVYWLLVRPFHLSQLFMPPPFPHMNVGLR